MCERPPRAAPIAPPAGGAAFFPSDRRGRTAAQPGGYHAADARGITARVRHPYTTREEGA